MMSMTVYERDEMLARAKDAIVEQARTPIAASELVQRLRLQDIDEYFVRAGIWTLIDLGKVELTRDQKISSVAAP